MPIAHNIDLANFSLAQLRQLADDIATELPRREHDERATLEDRLRSIVEEAGFDPADVSLAAVAPVRRRRKSKSESGATQ